MTIAMKDFGKFLITRKDAKKVLQSISFHEPTILDFSGVKVANHPFADELFKGIGSSFELKNANPYVTNCMAAGLATALQAAH